ncbi:g-protein coupled receptor moody [Trichonephila inaurata madagascariensis]|uniref:G-protein coupled receptor moody n=1 Tax=Trichonephila inaurata madagascariensis TaxID=2747483 RepID=A0A8X6XUA3_9ARAC|nr:g-protein coupled receptor moody [Trichonephila inaurata madagascariensis]
MTTLAWVMSPFVNNTTSDEGQDLVQFSTHGNDTVFFQYPPQLMDFAAACFIVFTVVGVFGNFVSILALSKSEKLRNATTAFIVNLCVADLLFSGFSMPLSALTFLERDWNYGEVLCKLFPLVRYSNGAVSIFSVIAITINRYILIVHPTLYREMYTVKNIAIMIGLIWISALGLLMFPLFEVWGRLGYDPKVGTCTILKLNGQSPKMSIYVAAFGIPSLVFLVCYSRIFWVVHKTALRVKKDSIDYTTIQNSVTFSSKKVVFWKNYRHSEMENAKTSLKRSKQELKVLKMLMIIFVTFILCYFPVSFVKIFKKEDDWPILNILGYLGVYFSNIINPVIYIVMSFEYRKAYIQLFCPNSNRTPKSSII